MRSLIRTHKNSFRQSQQPEMFGVGWRKIPVANPVGDLPSEFAYKLVPQNQLVYHNISSYIIIYHHIRS